MEYVGFSLTNGVIDGVVHRRPGKEIECDDAVAAVNGGDSVHMLPAVEDMETVVAIKLSIADGVIDRVAIGGHDGEDGSHHAVTTISAHQTVGVDARRKEAVHSKGIDIAVADCVVQRVIIQLTHSQVQRY